MKAGNIFLQTQLLERRINRRKEQYFNIETRRVDPRVTPSRQNVVLRVLHQNDLDLTALEAACVVGALRRIELGVLELGRAQTTHHLVFVPFTRYLTATLVVWLTVFLRGRTIHVMYDTGRGHTKHTVNWTRQDTMMQTNILEVVEGSLLAVSPGLDLQRPVSSSDRGGVVRMPVNNEV